MTAVLPADPFGLVPSQPLAIAARRTLLLAGGQVELLWLPQRQARGGVPTNGRPPFRRPVAERILAAETVWRTAGIQVTPNRFPLASRELLLWADAPLREPDPRLLEFAFRLEDQLGAAVLGNSLGAAASIPRAHLHLVSDRLDYLERLPRSALTEDWLEGVPGVEAFTLASPYPASLVGVRGNPTARAAAITRLLEARTTPAFNLVSQSGISWLFPRSAVEIPAPWFPHALGGAEVWGRWCYAEEAPFLRATAQDLTEALRQSGFKRN